MNFESSKIIIESYERVRERWLVKSQEMRERKREKKIERAKKRRRDSRCRRVE